MSKVGKKSLVILIITMLLSSLIPNLISYAANPSISITDTTSGKTSIEADVGDIISVDLNLLNGLENASDFQFTLEYNPEYIEVAGKGATLSKNIFSTSKGTTTDMDSTSEDKKTSYITGCYLSETGKTLNTSGKLATIEFEVLKAGEITLKFFRTTFCFSDNSEQNVYPTDTFTITVPIPMAGLDSTTINKTLKVGEKVQMSATKKPENTTDTTSITYTSSDISVATVDNTGMVTATGNGTAEILAKCGEFSIKCGTVKVVTELKDVKLNKSSIELHRGENEVSEQLVASVNSDITESVEFSYISSDTSVVTVDNSGKITAVGNGTATVTVTATSTDPISGNIITKTAVCTVKVDTPLTELKLESSSTLTFEIGDNPEDTASQKMVVSKVPGDTDNASDITYTSSNTLVATVDDNGNVFAKAKGEATITASCEGKTVTCKAVVTMPVKSITITNGNITLKRTQSEMLNVKFGPEGATDMNAIKWSIVSSEPVSVGKEVISLENGLVEAINPGIAVVRVTYLLDETIYSDIKVTVPEVNATELVINKTNTTIEKGESEKLSVTILPEDTTDELNVVWKSSDESVATVDNTGKVTAVGVGDTVISATMNGLEAKCNVNVISTLQSISLNKTEMNLIITEDDSNPKENLTVLKNPIDADSNILNTIWVSSATTVATVDNTGKVTAVGPGTTYITATLDGKTAECKVVVDVALTSVEIENGDSELELYKNRTGEMKVIFTPANATLIPTAVWSSSDESVATVDQNGIIKAINPGTAKITVTYTSKGRSDITASRDVVVKEVKATGVTIAEKPESLFKNEEAILEIQVSKDNNNEELTDKIYCSSSDDSVAYVSCLNGVYKVVGAKEGKATITVKVGNYSDEFDIEVKELHITSLKAEIEGGKVAEGSQAKINVTVNPSNYTDENKFTYTVDNEAIAKVVFDEDGNAYVKGISQGKAIITLTALNGVETSFEVSVFANTTNGSSSNQGSVTNTVSQVATSLVGSPHTGDMNVIALIVMAVISFTGMIIIIKKK